VVHQVTHFCSLCPVSLLISNVLSMHVCQCVCSRFQSRTGADRPRRRGDGAWQVSSLVHFYHHSAQVSVNDHTPIPASPRIPASALQHTQLLAAAEAQPAFGPAAQEECQTKYVLAMLQAVVPEKAEAQASSFSPEKLEPTPPNNCPDAQQREVGDAGEGRSKRKLRARKAGFASQDEVQENEGYLRADPNVPTTLAARDAKVASEPRRAARTPLACRGGASHALLAKSSALKVAASSTVFPGVDLENLCPSALNQTSSSGRASCGQAKAERANFANLSARCASATLAQEAADTRVAARALLSELKNLRPTLADTKADWALREKVV
jgi:hypothetical protein